MHELERVLIQLLSDGAFRTRLCKGDVDLDAEFTLDDEEKELLASLLQIGEGRGVDALVRAASETCLGSPMQLDVPPVHAGDSPSWERTAAKLERVRPKLERIAPKLERTAPKLERVSPKLERAVPKLERVAPKLERTEPKLERVTPKLERTAPKLERVAPKLERVESKLARLEKALARAESGGKQE